MIGPQFNEYCCWVTAISGGVCIIVVFVELLCVKDLFFVWGYKDDIWHKKPKNKIKWILLTWFPFDAFSSESEPWTKAA